MTSPIDLDTRRANRPTPLKVRSLADLQGRQIPERDWLIPSVLIRRSITLFAGDGGTGKSLMCQQLQVAAALGADWLGIPIRGPIQSFGFYCEDDDDELDRRFASICKHYGVDFSAVADHVRYISRVGEANELVTFRGRNDDVTPRRTALFSQIEDEISSWGAQLIAIDTAADTMLGNENARPQVRHFVNQIRRLSFPNNGGVLLTAHPSKSSMVDGSGFSGSTAWNGSVRNRLYLTHKKRRSAQDDEEEDQAQTDDRVLKIMKSNYGPFGEKIRCRWEEGVFVRTDIGAGSIVDRINAKSRVLEAAAELIAKGAMLSALHNTRGSLSSLVRDTPACKGFSFNVVRSAQEALEREGRLIIVPVGPPTRRRRYIRPVDSRYPAEVEQLEQEGNR